MPNFVIATEVSNQVEINVRANKRKLLESGSVVFIVSLEANIG